MSVNAISPAWPAGCHDFAPASRPRRHDLPRPWDSSPRCCWASAVDRANDAREAVSPSNSDAVPFSFAALEWLPQMNALKGDRPACRVAIVRSASMLRTHYHPGGTHQGRQGEAGERGDKTRVRRLRCTDRRGGWARRTLRCGSRNRRPAIAGAPLLPSELATVSDCVASERNCAAP